MPGGRTVKQCCSRCIHSQDYGESVLWIRCERLKRKKDVMKHEVCEHYKSQRNDVYVSTESVQ